MRGHDELRAVGHRVLDHRHQPELALGRERRLGLVEQEQPAAHQPGAEEREEPFAVRAAVPVLTSGARVPAITSWSGAFARPLW
jgi:hypothetical protein